MYIFFNLCLYLKVLLFAIITVTLIQTIYKRHFLFFPHSFLRHVSNAIYTFFISLLTELWAYFIPESITSGSGKQFKLGVVGEVWTFVGGIRISRIGHAVQGPWSNETCMAAITCEHLPSFFLLPGTPKSK